MSDSNGPIVGDFTTPDLFADEAIFFDLGNGLVRITLATVRSETPRAGARQALVATRRLILPAASAQRFALGLHDYLVKVGLNPSAAVRGEQTAQ